MDAMHVVVRIKKVAEVHSKIIDIAVLRAMDFFLLEGLHEALTFRVVVRIAGSAHARDHAMLKQGVDVSRRSVLHAAIGMMNQTRRWTARFYSRPQRFQRQFAGE